MGSDDNDHHDQQKFGTTLKFILAGMISLVGLAVFIIILQIYARYLQSRRQRSRRATLYPLTTFGTTAQSELLNSTEPPPKNGLDHLIIDSLPMFNYKVNSVDDQVESIECSVCLGTIMEEAKVRLLPNCKHLFHVECIDMWLGSHTNCPNCRTSAEPKLKEKESESDSKVQPTAPPLEEMRQECGAPLEKTGGGSCSRLSSFRKILTRERSSSRRVQVCGGDVGAQDLERQS